MYKSPIKEQFRNDRKGNVLFSNKDYIVLADLKEANKVLVVDPDTGLMSDLYKNKLEAPERAIDLETTVYVEAKNENYASSFNLEGRYIVLGIKDSKQKERGSGITPILSLKSLTDSKASIKEVFPSRVKVIEIEE